MKLKEGFITQDVDGKQFLVSVTNDFNGIAKSNETAKFIVDMLKNDTTEEKIIEAMCLKYDAPRDIIAADVSKIIVTLRSINAVEE